MPPAVEVEIEGHRLSLSNLDKVLYAETGFTKADVIDYYRRIAPVLLPHLRGRVPTLVRAPDGAAGQVFFEKRCPGHRPKWVKTAVMGRYDRHVGFEGCLIDTLPALVWVANLAALELHTYQARGSTTCSARPPSSSTSTPVSRRRSSTARGSRSTCARCSTPSGSRRS
jgi:Predicted eukaryotic-type DNA primase